MATKLSDELASDHYVRIYASEVAGLILQLVSSLCFARQGII